MPWEPIKTHPSDTLQFKYSMCGAKERPKTNLLQADSLRIYPKILLYCEKAKGLWFEYAEKKLWSSFRSLISWYLKQDS